MNKTLLALLLLSTFVVACAKEKKEEQRSYKHQYTFSDNSCETGEHTFNSENETDALNQYCNALQDEALNKSCAADSRKMLFEKDCPGRPWSPR